MDKVKKGFVSAGSIPRDAVTALKDETVADYTAVMKAMTPEERPATIEKEISDAGSKLKDSVVSAKDEVADDATVVKNAMTPEKKY